ncbi:MAG: hypothetical protein ABIR33_12635 [Pyrinomonadaceae bacterium]
MKEVAHSGGTAGYQTYLSRYPEKKLSVGALCNGFPPSAGAVAHSVVDEIFGPWNFDSVHRHATLSDDQLKKFVGIWRNDVTRNTNMIALDKSELKMNGGTLTPLGETAFRLIDRTVQFKNGTPATATIANADGSITRLTMVSEWKPTAADLSEFAGDWYSQEAQATFSLAVESDTAFLKQRPSMKMPLQPIYKDHFAAQGFVVWVTRDASGKIDKLHVGGSRMRDIYFDRVAR